MLTTLLAMLFVLQGSATPTASANGLVSADQYIGHAEVYPGQIGIAAKRYEMSGTTIYGLGGIDVAVRAFRTPQEARAGVEIRRDFLLEGIPEGAGGIASFPDYGDLSVAITAQSEDEDRRYDDGYLIVAQGVLLFTWTAYASPGTPIDDLHDLAEGFFPAPWDEYDSDDVESLLAVLPPLDLMPTGMVLFDEAALITDGTPRPATPYASIVN